MSEVNDGGFDAGPFSMLAVSALESHVQTIEFMGKKYAAVQYSDRDPAVAAVFCRGILGYNDHQEPLLRDMTGGGVKVKDGDWLVMVSRTEYSVLRIGGSESLFSLMPLVPLSTPEARLSRIAEAHKPSVGEGGLTDGRCNECNWPAKCPTHVWATQPRDTLSTWDPADDEESSDG